MEILELELVPLAIALLVPGLVAVKVYDLLVPGERRDWTASVLEVFAYGTLNFSLWFWALDFSPWRRRGPGCFASAPPQFSS